MFIGVFRHRNPGKVPFEVVKPPGDSISLSKPAQYEIRLTAQKKALQHMMYEWTGEVTADQRSYRVIGTGATGTFRIPACRDEDHPTRRA